MCCFLTAVCSLTLLLATLCENNGESKKINLLLTKARNTTDVDYVVLSRGCILAQAQSFHRVHFYTPNWIMGKTMAINECKSVRVGGANKTLNTIQETTKKLLQKETTSYDTIKQKRRVESSANTEHNKQATRQTTTTQNTGMVQHQQVEAMLMGYEGHGGSAPVCSQEILKSLFF